MTSCRPVPEAPTRPIDPRAPRWRTPAGPRRDSRSRNRAPSRAARARAPARLSATSSSTLTLSLKMNAWMSRSRSRPHLRRHVLAGNRDEREVRSPTMLSARSSERAERSPDRLDADAWARGLVHPLDERLPRRRVLGIDHDDEIRRLAPPAQRSHARRRAGLLVGRRAHHDRDLVTPSARFERLAQLHQPQRILIAVPPDDRVQHARATRAGRGGRRQGPPRRAAAGRGRSRRGSAEGTGGALRDLVSVEAHLPRATRSGPRRAAGYQGPVLWTQARPTGALQAAATRERSPTPRSPGDRLGPSCPRASPRWLADLQPPPRD